MPEIKCENCGKLFNGRVNRRTCSLVCRNALAVKRKYWDRHFRYVKMCEINSTWDVHSPEEREHWRKKGEEIKTKLLAHFGPRP